MLSKSIVTSTPHEVLLREREGGDNVTREDGRNAREKRRNVPGEEDGATGLDVPACRLGGCPAATLKNVFHVLAEEVCAGGTTMTKGVGNIRTAELEIR